DPSETPIDGIGSELMTQRVANEDGGPTGVGLPDDGAFPANSDHPFVQLHWNNNEDVVLSHNAHVLTAGGSFAFNVPPSRYTNMQLYSLMTNGPGDVVFTLTYDDLSTDTKLITYADWFQDAAAPQFQLVNGFDVLIGGNYTQESNQSTNPAITGV